jgi:hypothetical protein
MTRASCGGLQFEVKQRLLPQIARLGRAAPVRAFLDD